MPRCLLALGANLGDRRRQLDAAMDHLAAHPQVELLAASQWFETQPIGGPPGQTPFLNGAALIETSLAPLALLREIQQIERSLGRQREIRWDARSIDLDILLYDDFVEQSPSLQIPHPWLPVRRFVLEPAVQIAPQMRHPLLGWTIEAIWNHLRQYPPRFALAGDIPPGWDQSLAANVARLRDQPDCPTTAARSTAAPEEPTWLSDMRRRVALCQQTIWSHPTQPVVAPFWLEESRLLAARQAGSADEAIRQLNDLAERSLSPKLVMLAVGHRLDQQPSSASSASADTALGCDEFSLRQHLLQTRTVPWLEIPATDSQRFSHDVAAAIDCMQ